uniref:C1q domain-containing protein n=1 Tax=Monopterus albus TaxID=43700 RepID=A0A3Q3KDY5_MONAL
MGITVVCLLLLVCSVSTEHSNTGTDVETTAQQISYQQPCLQDVHAALKELTASLAEQKVEMRLLQRENEGNASTFLPSAGQVAFSASLLSDGEATIGPFNGHTALVFKNVVTNIGSAYDPNTGVFTAAVRGVYHFEWHIGVDSSNTAAVLVKNTNHIFTAYEHQTAGYGASSQSASLLLEAGDTVCVHQWTGTKIHDNQNHHSTFSGHLLFTL